MDCQVVHTTEGRCRIRVPRVAHDSEYASKLHWLIECLDFVTSARINTAASSLIVTYEANSVGCDTAIEKLLSCIQRAVTHTAELAPTETLPLDRPQVSDWEHLGFPSISLGLALAAAPLELPPLLIGAAIALAAMPWLSRATESIVTNQQPNVDLLDSLWMTFHTMNGQYIAPSLKTALVGLRRTLRGMKIEDKERQFQLLIGNEEQSVWVERDGQEQLMSCNQLVVGDCVIVYPGHLIPVDGRIIQGRALIDECHLTGDTEPVVVHEGQDVYASSLLLEGKIWILAERTNHNTRVGLALQLLETEPVYDTQIGTHQAEFAKSVVVPTICLGATMFALTGVYSSAIAPFQLDFGSGIQIAMPTAVLAALTYAARNGVYIRSGRVLELLSQLDAIVFEKTANLNQTIATLQAQGIDVYMVADDEQPIACKAQLVSGLRHHGRTVAVVGDGFDGAEVSDADISISFACGSDIEEETADIVLLDRDLGDLAHAINIARQAMEIVHQNAAIIIVPNIVVVVGGVFFGLNPVVNVVTNNFSAFLAEFIHSSSPQFCYSPSKQRSTSSRREAKNQKLIAQALTA